MPDFPANGATLGIAVLAVAGVVVRPGKFPEALWAMLGAFALVGFGLISPTAAGVAVLRGQDVLSLLDWNDGARGAGPA